MKCKTHPLEYGVGVCATCLRERLIVLIAARSAAAAPRSEPDPLPPALPQFRPFSPYVTHRRSVDTDTIFPQGHQHPRFYSTPQVAPVSTRNKTPGGFSIFSSLFRHPRSEEPEQNSQAPKPSKHGSWFSSLIPGRRKKKSRFTPAADVEPATGRRIVCQNRGMSPAAESESEEDDMSGSGYSTESTAGPRRPAATPLRRHVPQRGASGFAVCLSPLVWSSPNCRRTHQVGDGGSGVIGVSLEPRSTLKTHHHRHHHRHMARGGGGGGGGGGESLRPNRSRKLADIGRFH